MSHRTDIPTQHPLALVTGASGGIGREEDDAIHQAAAELSARDGVRVEAVQVDLRDPEGVERLWRRVTEGGRRLTAAALNDAAAGAGDDRAAARRRAAHARRCHDVSHAGEAG